MRYIITDDCLQCGACIDICPADAIVVREGEKSVIDSARCTGCGRCVREFFCPGAAIVEEDEGE